MSYTQGGGRGKYRILKGRGQQKMWGNKRVWISQCGALFLQNLPHPGHFFAICAWGKSGVASSSKFACGKGGLQWQSCVEVHTPKKGVRSTHFIKCVKRVFSFKCSLFVCNWWYQSVWKVCGKGIIFIDTLYTIRFLSNFAGRAATHFSSETRGGARPPRAGAREKGRTG